jgi:hypothetical protein
MTSKHIKKFSTSLAIKEMQIKTILRFYLMPVKMAIINNTTANAGEDVGETNHFYTVHRDGN